MRRLALAVMACVLVGADPGPPQDSSKTRKPEAKVTVTAVDPAKALAEYNARREKAPETAAGQWELGLWCEKNGLTAEAYTHFSAVVKLDPGRDAAWRKLGFTKQDGIWLNPAEVEEAGRQKKADADWAPKVKAIHKGIHAGGPKQEAAEEALHAIEDPRAVPTLFKEFGHSGATDQLIAVRALGQIDSPLSSKFLATLSIYGRSAEVRRQAVESLRGREPDEFLPVLAGMMPDHLKYEMHPGNGPGTAGVLFVNGRRFSVRRIYVTPPPPSNAISVRPGDLIDYDEFGLPVIYRRLSQIAQYVPIDGTFDPVSQKQLFQVRAPFTVISATNMIIQAQRGSQAARNQIFEDMEAIDELNRQARTFNEIVARVVRDATGKSIEPTRTAMRELLQQRGLYKSEEEPRPPVATFSEYVPIAFRPQYELSIMLPFFKVAPFN